MAIKIITNGKRSDDYYDKMIQQVDQNQPLPDILAAYDFIQKMRKDKVNPKRAYKNATGSCMSQQRDHDHDPR